MRCGTDENVSDRASMIVWQKITHWWTNEGGFAYEKADMEPVHGTCNVPDAVSNGSMGG